jgi:arylsulfatase A-like enzyme
MTHHIKDIVHAAFLSNEPPELPAVLGTYREGPDSELFGIAEGKNLIIITVESLQNFVIGLEYNGQEITPNINRLLLGNTIYFDNFYKQLGSGNTSDAEFAINNGLLGTIESYTNRLFGAGNYFRGLPVMLRDKGYDTAMFHAFERKSMWSRDIAYNNMGFNRFFGGLDNRPGDGVFTMDNWIGWGLADTSFFEQSIELMEELTEPFYGFFLTLTSHYPFLFPEDRRMIELLPEDEDTMMGKYFVTLKYADYAVGRFLDDLKERGWYDNSIIVVLGDNLALPRSPETNEAVERLIERPYDFDVMMNVPLLITIPSAELDIRQTISVAGGHMDVFPTLAYLMGFETLDTLFLGQNLLAITEGFVVQHTHMTKGSFFKNDIAFVMARNGVFAHSRAWNFRTGEPVPLEDVYEYHLRAVQIINAAEYILQSDAIRRIFVDGGDLGTEITMELARFHPPEIVKAGVPGVLANTIEAMDFSVETFYATVIRLELEWDGRLLGNGDLPLGFDSETGELSMSAFKLIDWMEDHAGATIVASLEFSLDGNVDDFMRHILERSPAAAERIVVELSSLVDHSGIHDTILNVSGLSESISEIKSFVERNNVWAIMMPEDDAEGRFAELLDLDTVVYVINEATGVITKLN